LEVLELFEGFKIAKFGYVVVRQHERMEIWHREVD